MKTIRIGNDIQISWAITRLNGPEDFSDKVISVSLIDKFNNKQKFEYTISENVISGTFYGKDQTVNGTYRLLLIENEGQEDMVTLDYIDCFLLSNKLKNHTAVGFDSASNINTEVVEVTSDVSLGGSGGDMSIYATKEYVNEKILDVEGEIPTATSDLNNDSDFVVDASYVHTDNNYTNSDKEKLGNIESGAEVNVQADWNETNSSSDAYIQNKPTIPTATSDLNNDSDFVVDASYVHTDNNYTNSDKEKLGNIESGAEVNVQADWSETNSSSDAYIQNKPTIPTATSDLNNDSDFVASEDCTNIVALTQTEYDNLQTVDANTLYIIKPSVS